MALSDALSAKAAMLRFDEERARLEDWVGDYTDMELKGAPDDALCRASGLLTLQSKLVDRQAGELADYLAPIVGEDRDDVEAYLLDGKVEGYAAALDGQLSEMSEGGRGPNDLEHQGR